MILGIKGKCYNFEIYSYQKWKHFCFFIKAKSKETGRTSCINNLNAILSALNVRGDDPKAADSTWAVTKNESEKYLFTSKQALSDPFFLDYLERQLDEDRRLSEWENEDALFTKNFFV